MLQQLMPCWHCKMQNSKLLFTSTRSPVLHSFEELGDGESSTLLAWWVFFESLKKLGHNHRCGHHRPQLFAPPFAIIHRLILVTLPRILTQVGHNRSLGRLCLTCK